MQIKELLKQDKDINIKDKRKILASLKNIKELDLLLVEQEELDNKIILKYRKMIKKLRKNLPIQYILNTSNFYGNDFYVNKNVLIPRPETELLVSYTYEYINKYFDDNIKILDVGVGSGAIAITLKLLNKNYDVSALDISKKALKVTKYNAEKLGVSINVFQNDLLENLNTKYDLLISNPPYIRNDSKMVEDIVYNNEPKIALFGGEDGLDFYRRILEKAKNVLNDKSIIALELGENQSKMVLDIARNYFQDAKIYIKKDFNEYERFIFILNNVE